MKIIKLIAKILIGIAVFLFAIVLVATAGVLIGRATADTPPFTDGSGNVLKNSIASLEKVELGGFKQTILIRGRNINNPVLLYLHGGPGSSELPLVRHFNSVLEDHFIVVNWDQRGASKSFSPFIDAGTMRTEVFLGDTYELVTMLKKRFGRDKIYLVGHSWGSYLGLKAVHDHPESFYAYVGIGQVINFGEGEKLSLQFAIDRARETGNREALDELLSIKNYPEDLGSLLDNIMIQRKWLGKFGGVMHGKTGMSDLFKIKRPPEFTLFDFIPFALGSMYSLPKVLPELISQNEDFRKTAPALRVPVYFITGRHDYNVPFELTEEYFRTVKAPKKELIWFENSAHMPNCEEPEKFNNVMINRVLAGTYVK